MKIFCLFAQLKRSYPGEFAPELYAAMDEYSNDCNPEYLIRKEEELRARKEYEFCKSITIDIDDESFDKLFFADNTIEGTVSDG